VYPISSAEEVSSLSSLWIYSGVMSQKVSRLSFLCSVLVPRKDAGSVARSPQWLRQGRGSLIKTLPDRQNHHDECAVNPSNQFMFSSD